MPPPDSDEELDGNSNFGIVGHSDPRPTKRIRSEVHSLLLSDIYSYVKLHCKATHPEHLIPVADLELVTCYTCTRRMALQSTGEH